VIALIDAASAVSTIIRSGWRSWPAGQATGTSAT
jgi:hypothetical protein